MYLPTNYAPPIDDEKRISVPSEDEGEGEMKLVTDEDIQSFDKSSGAKKANKPKPRTRKDPSAKAKFSQLIGTWFTK